MALLREALEVHRHGTVDERRRWVVRHPIASSFAVCLVATLLLTVVGLLVRPDAVTAVTFVVLFGATSGASLLLLALAGRASSRPTPPGG